MHYLVGDVDGATPLDADEADQLIPSWISTRGELDTAEQENIARAVQWAALRRLDTEDILDEGFVHELHRRMFEDVWQWAGSYRTSARNIGVEPWNIGQEVALALADARYWIDHATYGIDEICVRFHHRLVAIHPFPNGNGRHGRQMGDMLVESLGGVRFSWGEALAEKPDEARLGYIAALRNADNGDIGPLLLFART
jgi:mobile mystery protein B